MLQQFALGEVADEAAVCDEEVVAGQVFEFDPADFFENLIFDFVAEFVDGEELQIDGAAVAVVVADMGDFVADGGVDTEFFVELAGESFFGAFAGLNFAAGKLPLEGHGLIGSTLADEHFIAAEHESCYDEAQPSWACCVRASSVAGV